MSKSERLAADEAYAFLNVVAPRLEQLRRRLVVANGHLKSADPEQARLNAILESQAAFREFLAGIPHLSTLAEPIDILLEAVREDPSPTGDESIEGPPQLAEPNEPVPPAAPAPPPQGMPAPPPSEHHPSETWLQIGTALMIERLTTAGMPLASAEPHVESVYALVGLTQPDGNPISLNVIRAWRGGFISVRQGGWRGNAALKRKVTSRRGVNPIVEAQQRVADMAAIFRKIAHLEASKRRAQ